MLRAWQDAQGHPPSSAGSRGLIRLERAEAHSELIGEPKTAVEVEGIWSCQ